MIHSIIDELEERGLIDRGRDRLGNATIAMLGQDAQYFSIASGLDVVVQGDTSRDLFLLCSGRLGVLVDRGNGPEPVSYLEPGALVGEMAMVSGEPRSATVTAFRDSDLIRIPAEVGERLMAESATFSALIVRQLVERLRNQTLRKSAVPETHALAAVALDAGVIATGDQALLSALASLNLGTTRLIYESDGEVTDGADLTLHVASEPFTAWSRRVVRQSDRVLFFASAGSTPDSRQAAEVEAARAIGRPCDLILVHPPGTKVPSGASAWLGLFPPGNLFHARQDNPADHARIARLATGKAISIVLSGGGARGFAHVGVLRAFEEAGVPIDIICGTSMGALIGASAAINEDIDTVSANIHHGAVANNPFGDYTMPILALAKGRRMSKLLREAFGTTRIEDSWKTFFCVSANLTTGMPHVHATGEVWKACRSSAAIPGLVPPVVTNGEVLVDGAIMNNMPADVVHALGRGLVVGVDVSSRIPFATEIEDVEDRSLFWLLGPGRRKVPGIFSILIRSGTIGAGVAEDIIRAKVDLLITPSLESIELTDFQKFDEIVELGYRAAKDAIDRGGLI